MAANSRGSISSPPAEADEWGNARPFLSLGFFLCHVGLRQLRADQV